MQQESDIARGELTRRAFLAEGGTAVAGGSVAARLLFHPRAWWKPVADGALPHPTQREALGVLGRTTLRLPDSLPNASLPAGTDTIPQIEHVVVLMMENHSYDNMFGMLGRGPGQASRGDGFTLAADGLPAATNPYADGRQQRAFPMPTTCQLSGKPSQEWEQSHIQYANGRNDGFVISQSGPVAMGYWDGSSLPFTYALASEFPIGDRWFCSVLGQTDPNRRYLIAATSLGMTDDIGESAGGIVPDSSLGAPAPNGTIFQRLTEAGISWNDYNTTGPTGTTMELYPANDGSYYATNSPTISQFFTDAKNGTLPSFSLLDENYGTQSQEDPQNIAVGEGFLASVVDAIGKSPLWRKTILIITYDEHGGYYDHVPPPAALAPDDVPPSVQPGESSYDGFKRYGFRVPSVVISPYAKRDYVSHVVYDHTSILAFVERKWNLQALTYRDANANDLTDFLDLAAMKAGQPTFPELPKLPAPADTPARLACSKTGPGKIPAPIPAQKVEIAAVRLRERRREVIVELHTDRGTMTQLELELVHGHQVLARRQIEELSWRRKRFALRVSFRDFARGRYAVRVRNRRGILTQRSVRVR